MTTDKIRHELATLLLSVPSSTSRTDRAAHAEKQAESIARAYLTAHNIK